MNPKYQKRYNPHARKNSGGNNQNSFNHNPYFLDYTALTRNEKAIIKKFRKLQPKHREIVLKVLDIETPNYKGKGGGFNG